MPKTARLRLDLEDWCLSYVAAFEAFDIPAIGAHWSFPAMVISGGRQLVMPDAASFDRNTGALVDFYKRQNAQKVTRRVLSVFEMGPASAAMHVHDTISTPENEQITEWKSAYVLRQEDDNWRAIFADATGEAEAWAKRGTPLGR